MSSKIRVAIVDDHQAIIDGYMYRLSQWSDIEVVSTALYGQEVERLLERYPVDVLLLDVNIPISPDNPNPYPLVPNIIQFSTLYPEMKIMIISMYNHAALINTLMDAGAKGYILKDDSRAIRELGAIIHSVAGGGVYFSQEAFALVQKRDRDSHQVKLTPRQQEVLSLSAAYPDATAEELAKTLGIAGATYRNIQTEIYKRLGVRTKTAAIMRGRELGLIPPGTPTVEI